MAELRGQSVWLHSLDHSRLNTFLTGLLYYLTFSSYIDFDIMISCRHSSDSTINLIILYSRYYALNSAHCHCDVIDYITKSRPIYNQVSRSRVNLYNKEKSSKERSENTIHKLRLCIAYVISMHILCESLYNAGFQKFFKSFSE